MDNNLTGRRFDIKFRPVISFNESSYNSMFDGIDLIVLNLLYYIGLYFALYSLYGSFYILLYR